MSDIDIFTHTNCLNIVQLLISNTDINQHWYSKPWNVHIMANLYRDVPHDVISYEQANLLAASHHCNHSAETHTSIAV